MSKKENVTENVNEESKNFKISGIVKFAGVANEEKNVVTLKLTQERAQELYTALGLRQDIYKSLPIKKDKEDENLFYLKTSSQFAVGLFQNAKEVDSKKFQLRNIGEDSEVELFVNLKVVNFNGQESQVLYLKSVNVVKLNFRTPYNPFLENEENTTL